MKLLIFLVASLTLVSALPFSPEGSLESNNPATLEKRINGGSMPRPKPKGGNQPHRARPDPNDDVGHLETPSGEGAIGALIDRGLERRIKAGTQPSRPRPGPGPVHPKPGVDYSNENDAGKDEASGDHAVGDLVD